MFLARLVRVVAKELRVPATKERSEGGHGAGYNSKINLDGCPNVGDVVVSGLFVQV
jgi:hypothetical protein